MAKRDVNKITMLLFYYKWAMISHYYSTEIKSFYSNKFPSDQENNSRNISYLQKPLNLWPPNFLLILNLFLDIYNIVFSPALLPVTNIMYLFRCITFIQILDLSDLTFYLKFYPNTSEMYLCVICIFSKVQVLICLLQIFI